MSTVKKRLRKTLRQEVEEIARLYFIATQTIKSEGLSDSNGSSSDQEKYVARVENAFESLTEIEKEFINNDFFYQAYPNWWKKYYTRSKYYLIKKRSMMSFLEAFEYGY